jgi:L-lysine epsilon oxidase-like protein
MSVIYRVHPTIGIARVGDSPDEFFIGPEARGVAPSLKKPGDTSPGPGRYKDSQRRIKRQGARFRVYAYTLNDEGNVTGMREVTTADAQIEWEVHLANRKAAASTVDGTRRRNASTPERDLIVDPGPHRIGGIAQPMLTVAGTFMNIAVKLGDLLTDEAGRLVVLGGHGVSQSIPGAPLDDFADNDGWCDDVSDGPVRATLRLNGSTEAIAADPAWVVVAPPDFAPSIENVVTLYDAVYDMFVRLDPRLEASSRRVSFTRDIYPILRRVSSLHWVSKVAARRHAPGSRMHFLSRIDELSSNAPENADARQEVFGALRSPKGGGGNMPKLPPLAVRKARGASLTETQYARMERWAQGQFDADWPGVDPGTTAFDDLPEMQRPFTLDHAALEACVGGPFFPGIETSLVMLDEATYDAKRLRISTALAPGALTARMAVPWQADFKDCTMEEGADWWPGQRPNEVHRGEERGAPWAPAEWEYIDMVRQWSQLGFVVARTTDNVTEYVEDERFLERPATV